LEPDRTEGRGSGSFGDVQVETDANVPEPDSNELSDDAAAMGKSNPLRGVLAYYDAGAGVARQYGPPGFETLIWSVTCRDGDGLFEAISTVDRTRADEQVNTLSDGALILFGTATSNQLPDSL